ncbi:mannitol-1-phosphate 5-dehydrogenase [Pectinatus haikarae]|uniref:Mannitol-1-phosphate 5-dehydrogenase n=1 Tax=Pectinatus haikarae TaxID=349096 RepID=A0ABT9YBD3_9FIRM|nr:mannitol-1-phosphate 5-dehydrogenase [Pectinatus haikarae]MDQ0204856.1 mannitol-1-phosphate 5-dehydrogenase [Pectinatus haikarae]
MKAVHFGAGNIGRGFIGELLHNSGFEITFIEVDKHTVDYINKTNSYDVYIINDNYRKEVIDNVCAVSPITDEKKAIDAIIAADIITTSVCVDNLPKIAGTLAKGLKERLAKSGSKVNILSCENAFYATDMLKKALTECKFALTEEELDSIGCFPNVAVDRIALSTEQDGIRIPQIEISFELVIEKNKLKDPSSQPIKGAEYADNLGMYLERKLYVFNCGHATAAYLGYAKKLPTIYDALNDKAIYASVVAAMRESAVMMTKKFPFTTEELETFIQKILKRISLKDLHDEVTRVGRSPIRKLGRKDRLVGPAMLAQEYALPNEHLAAAIAAGYHFDYAEDEQAAEIQNFIKSNGIEKAVEKYSQLTSSDPLFGKIVSAYNNI